MNEKRANSPVSVPMHLVGLLVFAISVVFNTSAFAQDGQDYSRWLGKEANDLPTLLNEFESLCQRTYQHRIEQIKSPYKVAAEWNRAHCRCVARFFQFKGSVTYVQIVNRSLGNKLTNLPELPGELNSYIDAFAAFRLKCQSDPTYISEAEAEGKIDDGLVAPVIEADIGDELQSDRKWISRNHQGYAVSVVTRTDSNRLRVSCDFGAGSGFFDIDFRINDRAPPTSRVKLIYDNGKFTEYHHLIDWEARESCPSCADKFNKTVSNLRRYSFVTVVFDNGSSETFTLNGSSEALGGCTAG